MLSFNIYGVNVHGTQLYLGTVEALCEATALSHAAFSGLTAGCTDVTAVEVIDN